MSDCPEVYPETGQPCVRKAPHDEHLTSLARDAYCRSWFTHDEDETACIDDYPEHDDSGSNPYECRRCGAELSD